LEPKVPFKAANQGRGRRENKENYFRFSQLIQPGRRTVEDVERYPVVPESYGYGWGKMASNLHSHYQKEWAKHFPFLRKGGKVALAWQFQVDSQVIEK